jgi:hypothetical protein
VLQADRSITAIPGAASNVVGVDPLFVNPLGTQFAVAPSRLDAQRASVTITAIDPPVGIQSNYHLQTTQAAASGAIDRGVPCSNTPIPALPVAGLLGCAAPNIAAPLDDVDGQKRPQTKVFLRALRTPWDLGADEVPGN